MSERIEHIEQYLTGEMSETEKQVFEAEMQSDPHLRSEVDRVRIIDAALDQSVEDDLRARLRRLEAGAMGALPEKVVAKKRSLSLRLAAAASILILVSVGVWFLIGDRTSGLTHFSEQNYLAYDYTQLRGDYRKDGQFPFDLVAGDFDKAQAVKWFSEWLETNPNDHEARYILAHVLKERGETVDAKAQLAILISAQSVLWSEKAEWNYVLLSATDAWDNLADKTFEKMITNPAHSYHPQAIELKELMHR